MGTGGMRYGAGRPSYKVKAEQLQRVEIGRWHRGGYLRAGYAFTWNWHRGDERTGSVSVLVRGVDSLALQYTVGSEGEWRDGSQTICLTRTACRYGNSRPWFACPICQRRAGVLYMRGGRFACRHCQRVAYSSQTEDAMTRTWRKQRRIEATIGEDWQRPIGMRQHTYQRLLDQLDDCERRRDAAFCVSAAGLLRRIGLRNFPQ